MQALLTPRLLERPTLVAVAAVAVAFLALAAPAS
jgi:hypothetical protein